MLEGHARRGAGTTAGAHEQDAEGQIAEGELEIQADTDDPKRAEAEMTDAPPLRLKWRKAWPDKENDFAAWDHDGIEVGRFYWVERSPSGPHWSWTVTAFHARPTDETGPHHGTVEGTARDAARAVEAAYERWLAAGLVPWYRQHSKG